MEHVIFFVDHPTSKFVAIVACRTVSALRFAEQEYGIMATYRVLTEQERNSDEYRGLPVFLATED